MRTQRNSSLVALIAVVLLQGCASSNALDMAPTPYSAEQIREANPPGTVLVFRIEEPPAPPVLNVMRFTSGDAQGVIVENQTLTEDRTPIGELVVSESSWTELRDHAAFPASKTQRTETRCEVPSGTYSCLLYSVQSEEDGTPITSRFFFADTKPGPPVCYEREQAGQVTFRMVLLEDSRP